MLLWRQVTWPSKEILDLGLAAIVMAVVAADESRGGVAADDSRGVELIGVKEADDAADEVEAALSR